MPARGQSIVSARHCMMMFEVPITVRTIPVVIIDIEDRYFRRQVGLFLPREVIADCDRDVVQVAVAATERLGRMMSGRATVVKRKKRHQVSVVESGRLRFVLLTRERKRRATRSTGCERQ